MDMPWTTTSYVVSAGILDTHKILLSLNLPILMMLLSASWKTNSNYKFPEAKGVALLIFLILLFSSLAMVLTGIEVIFFVNPFGPPMFPDMLHDISIFLRGSKAQPKTAKDPCDV
jgi:hypothetical protein